MNDTINDKFEKVEHRVETIESSLLDDQTQLQTFKSEFHGDLVRVLNEVSLVQQ